VDNRLDGTQLQNDLDVLGDWAVKWKMNFNVEKCKFVHVYMDILSKLSSEKDLGVVFSNDLKVRRQCEEAYSKASQMLGSSTEQYNSIT